MHGKAMIIPADVGSVREMVLDDPATPATLEILQKAVCGYLELVTGFHTIDRRSCAVFCNEDGKLKNLPINIRATELWDQALDGRSIRLPHDVLVGDVVVVTGDDEFMAEL